MKAIVQDSYGSPDEVLSLQEIDKPVAGDEEVLVRVHATSVHADVWHVVSGRPFILRLMGAGLRKPNNPVPGTDMAGVVESVGSNVTQFEPGDEVFGESHSKLQWTNGGAFAEFVAAPQNALALKPEKVTFEQAAAVPTSGYIAVINLPREQGIQPGMRMLINGAGGGVGSIALQVAKAFGAHVTGVDSAQKLEMIGSLGADHVIDYTQEDFTQSSERYDFILDVASTLSLSDCKRVLSPTGKYVIIGHEHYGEMGNPMFGIMPGFFGLMLRSLVDNHLPKPNFSIPSKQEVMAILKELLETGQLTPLIDRTYPLSQVPEAMHYLQEGQNMGKIIIKP